MLTSLDSLISRIYEAKYFPSLDILNTNLGSNPSYAKRNLRLGVICKGKKWQVGNGRLVHILENKW